MFPLHLELWDAEPSPALTGLLAKVAQRVEERPELMGRSMTAYRLTAELAAGGAYGKPGMLWDATHVCIAFREDGRIYSLDEASGRSSGGWMGSCIPAGRVEAFARDWLEQTDPQRTEQIALF